MAGWSSLAFRNFGKTNSIRSLFAFSKSGLTGNCLNYVPARNSGHHKTFQIRLTQYKFMKLRDIMHLYFLIGALPLGALVIYSHIFIGPAKLAVIPENYVPKHWEYFEHPITRWIAKCLPSPQECYEKDMHKVYVKSQMAAIKKLELKIEDFMKERADYQAWYYFSPGAKYVRKSKEDFEMIEKQEAKSFGIVL